MKRARFARRSRHGLRNEIQDVIYSRVKKPGENICLLLDREWRRRSDFRNKDVVFESFHNFVALSQWGNTIYNIMMKLEKARAIRTSGRGSSETMEGDYDNAQGGPFTPLQRFVMELSGVISPNGGSISSLQQLGMREPERHGYAIMPYFLSGKHRSQALENPLAFDPERYKNAPASDQIGKERAKAIGFARCPFEKASFPVKDGRSAWI